ncbi:MAG: nitrite reductase, copper-containing, partial [Flavobacteriaceae bacterium]|nr:nitrite reductase, copper-containing [Flavobacteriaceae bacterium]
MKNLKLPLMNISTIVLILVFFTSCNNEKTASSIDPAKIVVSGTMEAELTAPPFVPVSVGDRPAKKLIVNMEILEEEGTMTDGTTYIYWTFGGSVPGSFIRTRVGDEVEFTLSNHPENKLPHNIDLHAVTGPGGG